MITKLKTDKGFTVYHISSRDHMSLIASSYFGYICDVCNSLLEEDVYYIPVLNYGMCPECYRRWYSNIKTYYDEDKAYEDRNIHFIENLFERLHLLIVIKNENE